MKAWHWTKEDRTLGYNDGRVVVVGEKLVHTGDIELCRSGLHASKRILDALQYAPGPYIWRVELSGGVVRGGDKLVATERTALWGFDATGLLRDFARRCALDVAHLWSAPEVAICYLKTGDESIRDAAYAAAREASAEECAAEYAASAGEAAGDAGYASWEAARFAVYDAATAAVYAAGEAAGYAASAARDRQNRRLTAMVAARR